MFKAALSAGKPLEEYFEFTPGILRAYVKPEHWDSLVFPYQQVLESRCKVTFKCGEVLEPCRNGRNRT